MPLIPRYKLSQTLTSVLIEVAIPHVRVSTSTLDLIIDGNEMHLFAPPTYLLKLVFPGRVVDEDLVEQSFSHVTESEQKARVQPIDNENSESAAAKSDIPPTEERAAPEPRFWTENDLPKVQYDPEKNHGTLFVTLFKETHEFWKDLDLIGRLQQPKKCALSRSNVSQPFVEVLDDKCYEANLSTSDMNTELDSTDIMEQLLSVQQKSPRYGLFQRFSRVFLDYAREGLAHEMLERPNPDEILDENCREKRLKIENEKFDLDRFLTDQNIDEEGDMIYDAAIMMVPHWMEKELEQSTSGIEDFEKGHSFVSINFFTAEESHLLATLPPQINIFPKLSIEQTQSVFLTLVDILFAYAYDHRTTDGDPTVESSWTVMILSPSLAWLENYNSPYDTFGDVLCWCVRRALIYPYIRSYAFCKKLINDVVHIIISGRRTVIRCLLQLHQIMEKSESHYLFNKLYIDPLIGWVQNCEDDDFQRHGEELQNTLSTSHFLFGATLNEDYDKHVFDILRSGYLGLLSNELELSFDDVENLTSSDEESISSSDSDVKSSANNSTIGKEQQDSFFETHQADCVDLSTDKTTHSIALFGQGKHILEPMSESTTYVTNDEEKKLVHLMQSFDFNDDTNHHNLVHLE